MADNVADKAINELEEAYIINGDDLFVLEQNQTAKRLPGSKLTEYVTRNIQTYDGEIVASNAAGGATYDGETLTLQLPHGPGISRVERPSRWGHPGESDTYKLFCGPVRLTDQLIPEQEIGSFTVYNGADGNGRVKTVMGIRPDEDYDYDITTKSFLETLLPIIWPVGYIYISTEYTSPGQRFSTYDIDWEWEKIEGRYLVTTGKATNDSDCPTFVLDSKGGAYKFNVDFSNGQADIGFANAVDSALYLDRAGSGTKTFTAGNKTPSTGTMTWTGSSDSGIDAVKLEGTQEIKYSPLYYVVNAWKRTR